MTKTLHEYGLLHDELFEVSGPMVELYNRCLTEIIGRTTKLDRFHIDKRGESPEIEEELGRDYLQAGPSKRFVIVVSPYQRSAPLIHEEFSFDNKVLDHTFNKYSSTIETVTRVDGLYGEMNDHIRHFTEIGDLLGITEVDVELRTPSNFITTAKRMQEGFKRLKDNPNLILENDSALIKELYTLVEQVGPEANEIELSEINVHKEIESFYTRLFDGVYVIKGIGAKRVQGLKRPKRDTLDKVSGFSDFNFTSQASSRRNWDDEAQREKDAQKTLVIYANEELNPHDGPNVDFVRLSDIDSVINSLLISNLVEYSIENIDRRQKRLEELELMRLGVNVPALSENELYKTVNDKNQEIGQDWHDLRQIERRVDLKGHKLSDLIDQYNPQVRSALLVSKVKNDAKLNYVISNLLTKLWEHDYESMITHNTRDLEHTYANAGKVHKTYIRQLLRGKK